jgi:hypothetical protein
MEGLAPMLEKAQSFLSGGKQTKEKFTDYASAYKS